MSKFYTDECGNTIYTNEGETIEEGKWYEDDQGTWELTKINSNDTFTLTEMVLEEDGSSWLRDSNSWRILTLEEMKKMK